MNHQTCSLTGIALLLVILSGCLSGKSDISPVPVPNLQGIKFPENPGEYSLKRYGISDSVKHATEWQSTNVHDPSVIYHEGRFYLYSTDTASVINVDAGALGDHVGIQMRVSNDLVHWQFLGWALKGGIPEYAYEYVKEEAGTAPTNMWAPWVFKSANEWRMYYSVSRIGKNTSVIGLAVAEHPAGPWIDKGEIIKANRNSPVNTIDASIGYDVDSGEQWLAYGSYWQGLRLLPLNPVTGAIDSQHEDTQVSKWGVPIANMRRNPNSIEAPVIIYNPEHQYYYLFFSTGWIDNSYHVRVGRSKNIRGPYFDDQDRPLVGFEDSGALVTAPYRFSDVTEPGWSGVGHADVIRHDGEYYIFHNARVAGDSEWIHLNVRRLYWSSDGWPMAMPQRYAGEITQNIDKSALPGVWQVIYMDPEDKSILSFQTEKAAAFESEKTVLYPESWQRLDERNRYLLNGFEVTVTPAWDWERGEPGLQFSGRNKAGVVIWGVSRF